MTFMKKQSIENHTRFHPLYHYFMLPLGLFSLIYTGIRLSKADQEHHLDAFLHFLGFLLIFCTIALVRLYALKVQDRAIRAEENFRHFLLTGKPFDSSIKSRQIIALRFASDEEFPALTQQAIEEGLTEKEIKKRIVHWRADYKRV